MMDLFSLPFSFHLDLGVVPILIGPLQALMVILPAVLVAIGRTLLQLLKPSSIRMFFKVIWRNKLGVVVALALLSGAVYGITVAREWLNSGSGKADRGQADWPMFRGGLTRTGASPGEYAEPTAPANVWAFTRDTKTFYSSPSVLGKSVFVSSVAGIGPFNMNGNGAIYCLDADKGGVIWKYAGKDFRATFSSPAVAGEYLVCGEGLHLLTDARLTCLKLKPGSSPEVMWEYRTRSHVESSPCIYEGKAYVGAGDDGFFCFGLEPGADGKADIKWHLKGTKDDPNSRYGDCEASPAAANGNVYFCLGMGGKAVVCVDANTGAEKWRQDAPYPVFGHPTVFEGKVYVGMGNGNFVETAEQVRDKEIQKLKSRNASPEEIEKEYKALAAGGELWCLDAEKGDVLWKFKTEQCILGAAAISDGRLFFGDRGGSLISLSLDAKSKRVKNVHEPIIGSPAVGKDHVYFITDKGKMYCLDKKTLEPVWQMGLGQGMFLSSPALGNGHLYVGTDLNGLVCVGEAASGRKAEVWSGALGGPGDSGWVDRSAVPDKGKFGWRYPKSDDNAAEGAPGPELTAAPAYHGGSLFLAFETPKKGIVQLVLSDDPRKNFAEGWTYETPNAVVVSPVINDRAAIVVDGRPGDKGRRLHVLEPASGKRVKDREVSDKASGQMLLVSDAVLVYDGDDRLSCYDVGEAGVNLEKPRWTHEVKGPVGAPCLANDMIMVVQSSPASVQSLCRFTGSRLWEAPLKDVPRTGVVAREGRLALGTEAGVSVLSGFDGAKLWSTNACGPVGGALVADPANIACVGTNGSLRVLDWSGQLVGSHDGGVPGITPMLCGDNLVVLAPGMVDNLDLAAGKRKAVLSSIGWLGETVTPAIMVKSQLFYGTRGKGLVCIKAR